MTASDRWEKPVVRIALLLCVLSFLLMIYAGYKYRSSNTDEKIQEEAEEDAHNKAGDTLENVSGELNSTGFLTEGIANNPGSGKLKNDDSVIEKCLRGNAG